jgi:DNA-binding NarL/FixJ family response regulator
MTVMVTDEPTMAPMVIREAVREAPAREAAGRDRPGLNLAVVIDDEVVRCGFGAMLRNLDVVHDVVEHHDGAGLTVPEALDKLDILVVSRPADDVDRQFIESAGRAGLKILIVLDGLDIRELSWAATLTAHGFIRQQGLTAERLSGVLSGLSDGHVFMPTELARELLSHAGYIASLAADEDNRSQRPRAASLTAREQEALALLAHGLVNKQIARRLRISEHGAKRLVASVLAKLGCPNRTLAVAVALREGLVKPT